MLIDEALSAYKQMETESFIAQRSVALKFCLSSVVTPDGSGLSPDGMLHSFMNKDKRRLLLMFEPGWLTFSTIVQIGLVMTVILCCNGIHL